MASLSVPEVPVIKKIDTEYSCYRKLNAVMMNLELAAISALSAIALGFNFRRKISSPAIWSFAV